MIATHDLINRLPSPTDRRELRNFARFLRLWPKHQPDMLRRSRWQKYVALTPVEGEAMNRQMHWVCPVCGLWHEMRPTCARPELEQ